MSNLPFPSNENGLETNSNPLTGKSIVKSAEQVPWKKTSPGEAIPIMFQVDLMNGNVISFAYSDLREIRQLSKGYVQLCIYGFEKYLISIEGRNLTEFATLMAAGRIKSFVEKGMRTFEHPEDSPSIDKVSVEALTGHEQ